MEKKQKNFFFRRKRVIWIRNDAGNPIKMVLMLYNDDFGSKITFFWRLGKILCLRKISKNERNKKMHLSWQCIYKNQHISQVSWSAMNALQFGTNSGFPAQFIKKLQPSKDRENWKNDEKNRQNVWDEIPAFSIKSRVGITSPPLRIALPAKRAPKYTIL